MIEQIQPWGEAYAADLSVRLSDMKIGLPEVPPAVPDAIVSPEGQLWWEQYGLPLRNTLLFDMRMKLGVAGEALACVMPRYSEYGECVEENKPVAIQNMIEVLEHPHVRDAILDGHITLAMIRPQLTDKEGVYMEDKELAQVLEHAMLEDGFLPLVKASMRLSREEAAEFYGDAIKQRLEKIFAAESNGKSNWDVLLDTMSGQPGVTVYLLYHQFEDAVGEWRARIGKTNPAEAAEGTIRRDFARTILNNLVHGSDSRASVVREVHLLAKWLMTRLT